MIDLRKEERAIRKALRSAADKARAAGYANPEFYVEPEGPTIHMMDGDHPAQKNSAHTDARQRQEAVVGMILVDPKSIGAKLDVGAW